MTTLHHHVSIRGSAAGLLTHRFSRHPERYLEILRTFRRHELHHVVAELGASRRRPEEEDNLAPAAHPERNGHGGGLHHAEGLAAALEELGPCFIKLGQLLSTRPDLLPAPYIRELSRLQATIAPVPAEQIVRVIESDLGAPVEELFKSFDREPLATASIAQVHRAVRHDGREVAVKVQRPGVRQQVEVDIAVLYEMARLATRLSGLARRYNLPQMVRELEMSLDQELDFRQEAENTQLIGRQIAEFKKLATPEVHLDFTTRRVLTLGFVRGHHLPEIPPSELTVHDTRAIARDLMTAYLKQMVVDGAFHCDPHPGNILLTEDGRLSLLDFGMVGRFDAAQKDYIILLLLAFAERQGSRVAETYMEMVAVPKGFDRRAFVQDVSALVSRYHDLSGGRMAMGTALLELTKLGYRHRAPVPGGITLMGKALLNLDGTLRTLSPKLDPVGLIRDYMLEVMEKRLAAGFSPGRLFAWALDLKHLAENTPRRADLLLDKLANDQFTLRLEIDQLQDTARTLNRAAGRLSLSLVASALIVAGGFVGGALLRRRPEDGLRSGGGT